MIVVVTPFFLEAQALLQNLDLSPDGAREAVEGKPFELEGKRLKLLVGGVGRTELGCTLGSPGMPLDISGAILAGCAGALIPDLPIGTPVFAGGFYDREPSSYRSHPQPAWQEGAARQCGGVVGCIVTVDRLVSSGKDRRRLRSFPGALVADMESWAFMQAMEGRPHHWAVLRAASDHCDVNTRRNFRDNLGAVGRGISLGLHALLRTWPHSLRTT